MESKDVATRDIDLGDRTGELGSWKCWAVRARLCI